MKENIGVLGSGPVGQTLASGFLKKGYAVMMGTRQASKLAEWKAAAGKNAQVGSLADAARFGQVLVLATKGSAAAESLMLAGGENLSGKTIIDATNPIADTAPQNGVLNFFSSLSQSLHETLQAAFPKANLVKAFNSVGAAFMVDPDFGGPRPTMCICGNNDGARATVARMVTEFGFEAEDMGKAEAARAIEPLCMLWCIPGFLRNDWAHAFKLLKR